ncbi:MAG TPA: ABC transporter substrate-binding protein [Acidimicrobiales bacterium]|jgi:peptide/nickel transport system substrate-binding protein|nr:ABC transporter substrate-binding protein [Acidimicrobiales bacterium]
MSKSFDRRSFLAGGLALGAGAALLGGEGVAGASETNGPGRNGIATGKPVKGGSLTMGIDTEESGFDPTSARWDEGGFLYGRSVFDPIAIVNAQGNVEPYLAQSITSNADFTQFVITLKPGILFHDGTPLDSSVLHLNLEKQASSALVGPAFATNISDVSVSGPLSVTITTKTPWEPLPYYFAQAQTGYVAAPAMLNNPNGTSHPIGTGPFVFQEWIPNSHMTATKNPNYWRKGYPYLDSITFKPIIDPNARAAALDTGEIDMMHTNSPTSLQQFRGDKKWSYYDNSGQVLGQPTVQCIMLNTAAAPFNNKQLREAAAMCINEAQFSKVIDKGVDAPMHGLFIPGSEYYTSTSYPSYDPHGAARLVSQIKRQGGSVSFNLNATSNSDVQRAAQFLQQAFQQAGMSVSINTLAQSTLINDALAGTYQATTWRQFGAVDPDLNYVWWTTQLASGPLALNMARNVDPRVQAALVAGRTTGVKSERVKQYQSINKYLAEDIPYLWLARDTWAVVANPKVQNFANPMTPNGSKAVAFDEGVLWPTQIWV